MSNRYRIQHGEHQYLLVSSPDKGWLVTRNKRSTLHLIENAEVLVKRLWMPMLGNLMKASRFDTSLAAALDLEKHHTSMTFGSIVPKMEEA